LKEAHFIYKDNETIQIRIFNSIQNVDKEWEALAAQDYFLQPAFLSNIEMQLKEVLVPNYITIYHQNKIIGIIYTQLITFNAQFFNENVKENFLVKLQKNSLYCLLDWIQTKLLVVGNIYLTGQHGFIIDNAFDKNFILNNVVKTLSKHLKTRVSIIKDIQVNELNIDGYNQIEVQPNMIFYNKNWTNFDDYLNALNSKHRVKAKKIISLGSALQLEKLQTMNSAISQTLYDLYLKMIENASYNLSKINKNYIEQLFYLENAHIYTVKLNGQIEAFFRIF
jgi:predicted N-acyltransferase